MGGRHWLLERELARLEKNIGKLERIELIFLRADYKSQCL